jgi:hypothetical protein
MKEPLVVPTKCIAPTWGIIVFIWPIPLQNDMKFTKKKNSYSIGYILRDIVDIVDFTIYGHLNLPPI